MLAARSGMRVPMADGRGRGEAVGGATQRGVKIRQLIRSAEPESIERRTLRCWMNR